MECFQDGCMSDTQVRKVEAQLQEVCDELRDTCRTCDWPLLLPHTKCILCGESVHPPHLMPTVDELLCEDRPCSYQTNQKDEVVCYWCSEHCMKTYPTK